MPFGLKIGPQRFQRFINEVMSDAVKSGNVVVYMDDILIANGWPPFGHESIGHEPLTTLEQ